MKIRLTLLTLLLCLGFALQGLAEPCTKTCNQCCPASAPCCPKANCTQACKDCCKSDDACCSPKKSKCSTQGSVPLERGGAKISPYGDKGCARRY